MQNWWVVRYSTANFSSFHDLIVAWFNNSWIGAEAVIVQIPTQGLKEVVTRSYIERKFDLPVNCWMEPLPLSFATTVTRMLESKMNLETLEDGVMLMECLEIPQTVNNTVMNMLEENRVEKSFCQDGLWD